MVRCRYSPVGALDLLRLVRPHQSRGFANPRRCRHYEPSLYQPCRACPGEAPPVCARCRRCLEICTGAGTGLHGSPDGGSDGMAMRFKACPRCAGDLYEHFFEDEARPVFKCLQCGCEPYIKWSPLTAPHRSLTTRDTAAGRRRMEH